LIREAIGYARSTAGALIERLYLNAALTIVGSIVIGGLVASALMPLPGHTPEHLLELTFTTLAAYGSFFIAEHYHVSSVLTALTAGQILQTKRG
jgi:NhaP-type Na+/H+ or K+/H+ antiporter